MAVKEKTPERQDNPCEVQRCDGCGSELCQGVKDGR